MHLPICVYICKCIYLSTYSHVCIRKLSAEYKESNKNAYTCTFINMYPCNPDGFRPMYCVHTYRFQRMYVCLHMYVYTYVCMCAHDACAHIHVYESWCKCIHTNIHTYQRCMMQVYTYIHTHIPTMHDTGVYIQTNIHTYNAWCMCIHTYTHTYRRCMLHVYTYIHAYIPTMHDAGVYIHIYIHTYDAWCRCTMRTHLRTHINTWDAWCRCKHTRIRCKHIVCVYSIQRRYQDSSIKIRAQYIYENVYTWIQQCLFVSSVYVFIHTNQGITCSIRRR